MKQLALAMHNYHDVHGRLPPAVVYGSDGQALYSWRVLLLPYLEQAELYRQFHLEESWDSPHNLALLARMPSTYAPPGRKAALAPPYHTFCQVFVGGGTAFESPQGETYTSFTDGTSNTLLLIEGGTAVPWTKPADVPFAIDQPLPPLATLFRDSLRVAFADGSVRFLKKEMDEQTFRALITRNGGERPVFGW